MHHNLASRLEVDTWPWNTSTVNSENPADRFVFPRRFLTRFFLRIFAELTLTFACWQSWIPGYFRGIFFYCWAQICRKYSKTLAPVPPLVTAPSNSRHLVNVDKQQGERNVAQLSRLVVCPQENLLIYSRILQFHNINEQTKMFGLTWLYNSCLNFRSHPCYPAIDKSPIAKVRAHPGF
jgi:hypothetical protein